jgi:hypothetical protein
MNPGALFNTIPRKNEDYLALFESGKPDFHKVVDLLEFKKSEVANASSVPLDSVRYDAKMPKALEERLLEWAVVLAAVGRYFKDPNKAVLWFKIPNPLLGGVAPRDMIRVGRFQKLHRFIQNALDENERSVA